MYICESLCDISSILIISCLNGDPLIVSGVHVEVDREGVVHEPVASRHAALKCSFWHQVLALFSVMQLERT